MIAAAPPGLPPDLRGPIMFDASRASPGFMDQCLRRAIERLYLVTPASMARELENANETVIDFLHTSWTFTARGIQVTNDTNWQIWLLLGGRGSGKTRAGAEWVRARVKNGARRIALVGPTFNAAREVMIEGESGLLAIGAPHERPVYISSRRRLEWPCGAIGLVFSSDEPDGLRGAQCDTAWADEFCAWKHPDKTLSNLRLGLRLTTKAGPPQLTVTTTPKPTPALRSLMESQGLELGRMRTCDNAGNLAPGFAENMQSQYGGTRKGRQELDGEIMTDHEGALWTRAMIERACSGSAYGRAYRRADFGRVVIAIDPPVSCGAGANACGIIVAGAKPAPDGKPDKAVILHDGTLQGRSPEEWAGQVARLFEDYDADYLVAEANQGGEMVRSVLRQAGAHMAVRLVHAAKSKTDRASPVVLKYEQGRISHAARFPALEDELCQLGAAVTGGQSPDRADALVWAVTELLLKRRPEPRVRVIG